jgi:hypothetical protein
VSPSGAGSGGGCTGYRKSCTGFLSKATQFCGKSINLFCACVETFLELVDITENRELKRS